VHGRVTNLQNEPKQPNNENKRNLRKNHQEKMYQNKSLKAKGENNFHFVNVSKCNEHKVQHVTIRLQSSTPQNHNTHKKFKTSKLKCIFKTLSLTCLFETSR
jgi:hypothetical protein